MFRFFVFLLGTFKGSSTNVDYCMPPFVLLYLAMSFAGCSCSFTDVASQKDNQ